MRTPILSRIRANKCLVGDGAMGSWLLAKGLGLGECPEQVNLTHPEWIEEILCAYVAAGADLVQANTFGASPRKLASFGLEHATEEINSRAVEIARRAAGDRAWVVASVGPTGSMLQPYGDAEPAAVQKSYERQARTLAESGVDAVLIETMMDVHEAILAVRAVRSVAPQIPVLATLTFDPTPRGYHTMMGQSVADCAIALETEGVDALGSNCGHGTQTMVEVARALRHATRLPLVVQANAGLPVHKEGRVEYPEPPDWFAAYAKQLIQIGVSVVGGCCGTTPDHIRAIRGAVDASG